MNLDLLSVDELNALIDKSSEYTDVNLYSEITSLRKHLPADKQRLYVEPLLNVINKENLDYLTRENALFTMSYWQPKGFKEKLLSMIKNHPDNEIRAMAIHFYTSFYQSGTKDKTLLSMLFNYVKDNEEAQSVRTHAIEGMMYVFYGKDNMNVEERGHWRSFANYPPNRIDTYESRIPWDELDKIITKVNQ